MSPALSDYKTKVNSPSVQTAAINNKENNKKPQKKNHEERVMVRDEVTVCGAILELHQQYIYIYYIASTFQNAMYICIPVYI